VGKCPGSGWVGHGTRNGGSIAEAAGTFWNEWIRCSATYSRMVERVLAGGSRGLEELIGSPDKWRGRGQDETSLGHACQFIFRVPRWPDSLVHPVPIT